MLEGMRTINYEKDNYIHCCGVVWLPVGIITLRMAILPTVTGTCGYRTHSYGYPWVSYPPGQGMCTILYPWVVPIPYPLSHG
jgi:hypothetical protein